MDKGGSVTYLERNDTVIRHNRTSGTKWAFPNNLINGIVLLNKHNQLIIEKAKAESYYAASDNEKFAIVTGPLLLKNAEPQDLPNSSFVNKRHPRSCLCTTKNTNLLIAIDGRKALADGMNLKELQQYLLSIGCVNAINLDGGGSTTLWTKNKILSINPVAKANEAWQMPYSFSNKISKNHFLKNC